MTRRVACRYLLGAPVALWAQNRPDSFKIYSEPPRLLLRPARLKLLRRERERRSLRSEQFETLWAGRAQFPEPGWTAALRYQINQDEKAAKSAIAWATGPGDDVRQIALVADWCAPLLSAEERSRIFAKLRRSLQNSRTPSDLAEARARVFAAITLSEAESELSQRALEAFFDQFWSATLIAGIRSAKIHVMNPDAYALLEILHSVRDNLNFDLRDTYPAWFKQYPLIHLMAHYPAPWPAGENEFHIPADLTITRREPDVRKAALSRAAELAMVALDPNSAETQVLQGWLTNDRFLMRGPYGIPYELLWANPYQPGLSYYHVPLALHDEIGGQLFVRSSWEDDASWIAFFSGQLQLFKSGSVTQIDPRLAREPLDIEEATVFFGRETKKFTLPQKESDDVFIVGLEPRRRYHIEIDDEEMFESAADAGGIVFLPGIRGGVGVRLGPATAAQPAS